MEHVQHFLVVNIQNLDALTAEISSSFAKGNMDRVCMTCHSTAFTNLTNLDSLLHPEWAYISNHKPFEKLGMDVFIVASPTRLSAFVADAEAITQITSRRNDFPKPLEMYGALDIYGKNLVTTEGSDWRGHRKLVAPSFGEKNNELVFIETLHHAQSMLSLWTDDGRGNQTVADPSAAAMNFALYVISSAGFDVRVKWPHEEGINTTEMNDDNSMFVGSEAPAGHTMNYREALSELLHNIMWTQIMPLHWLRKFFFFCLVAPLSRIVLSVPR
jgi:cytochrome P450